MTSTSKLPFYQFLIYWFYLYVLSIRFLFTLDLTEKSHNYCLCCLWLTIIECCCVYCLSLFMLVARMRNHLTFFFLQLNVPNEAHLDNCWSWNCLELLQFLQLFAKATTSIWLLNLFEISSFLGKYLYYLVSLKDSFFRLS